jgi:hypothetical protein
MKRPTSMVLLAALLMSGCANTPIVMPPGEDRHELVAAIASRGEGGGPVMLEPEPRDSSVVPTVIKTTAKVGETCLLLGGIGTLAFLGKGQGAMGQLDFNRALGTIWSDR